MRLLHPIIFGSLLLLVGSSQLPAQVIALDRRVDLLNRAEQQILAPVENVGDRLAETVNPFFPKVEEVIESELEAETAPAAVAAAPKLSDEALLNLIGKNFKPTGSLILGERRMLVLAGGGNLSLGDAFSAKVNDQVHRVEIADITSSGYTLRLRGATLTQAFLKTHEGISSEP